MAWLLALLLGHANGYRQIDKNKGNCIVSQQMLPLHMERDYREVRKRFDSKHRPREVRCYLSGPLRDERKIGSHFNELRDQELWHNRLLLRTPDGEEILLTEADYGITPDNEGWDQARMQIWSDTGHCDFRHHDGKCVDIDAALKKFVRAERKLVPYTAELCFSLFFRFTDTYSETIDRHQGRVVKRATNMRERVLAEGCVEYTTPTLD